MSGEGVECAHAASRMTQLATRLRVMIRGQVSRKECSTAMWAPTWGKNKSPPVHKKMTGGDPSRMAVTEGAFYCTALIMSKIGRYMLTTIPPTTTPRNTIITGSRRLNKFVTAASTSLS